MMNINNNEINDYINSLTPDDKEKILNFKESTEIIKFRKKYNLSLRALRRLIINKSGRIKKWN